MPKTIDARRTGREHLSTAIVIYTKILGDDENGASIFTAEKK